MKMILGITSFLAVIILQACSPQLARTEPNFDSNSEASSTTITADIEKRMHSDDGALQLISAKSEPLTIPETQIIRELHNAGCIIEEFQLDRRKQNIHIRCARDTLATRPDI